MENVVILSAKRTPVGSFQGNLAGVTATQLGSAAIQGALQAGNLNPSEIDEVFMGCVLPGGLGQAPARQAALGAGLPQGVPCATINKVCGSGMKAVMIASDGIKAGSFETAIAGGMESMSNAPYILPKVRSGYRMGHGSIFDHMLYDGLENAYDHVSMGAFADNTAEKFQFTRENQDSFSIESGKRALKAVDEGQFDDEIVPVTVPNGKETLDVSKDEPPGRMKFEKIPTLKPAFSKDGTVTAANSSSISDGASALVLSSQDWARNSGHVPMAKICGYVSFAQAPEWFTTAPIGAIQKLLTQVGWNLQDVDLFEINEAFAVVVLAAMKELNLSHNKVNVLGGACALGHPIGSSGSRLIVTLLHALKSRGLKRGIAALCIGGGEATAIAVEMI
ncbi:Acetyl-CoA acetyltransferase [Candidatus Bealeia paramacronuclearis]|uniref:Acetyl-CoA acetyltransferase n=1 Tax=Candidatus Bealeia paramacronuclearis TaxID=1921001 RepID=A0ABZ2C5E6_9PROT|nr:Acetyl-CoA acetyltransferase [Candidatus Bealeia paramacronuclearis]